jgi:hypothetical protein
MPNPSRNTGPTRTALGLPCNAMADVTAFVPDVAAARTAGLLDGVDLSGWEELALCGLVVRAQAFTQMVETYVPKMMTGLPALFGFESAFEAATTPMRSQPPSCLRCHDLRPQQSGGAYRAAQVTKEPMFHGHQFADTIDQAEEDLKQFFLGQQRQAREREAQRVPDYEIAAFAWPLRWLRHPAGAEEVVLYIKHDTTPAVFRGTPPEPD